MKSKLIAMLFIFAIGVYIGCLYSNSKYQPQIQGLSEQVSRQTKRIAELTGNGG